MKKAKLIVEDLLRSTEENNIVLERKRGAISMLKSVCDALFPELQSLSSSEGSSSHVKEVCAGLISSLNNSLRAGQDELIKLEATQDGMNRALRAVAEKISQKGDQRTPI